MCCIHFHIKRNLASEKASAALLSQYCHCYKTVGGAYEKVTAADQLSLHNLISKLKNGTMATSSINNNRVIALL